MQAAQTRKCKMVVCCGVRTATANTSANDMYWCCAGPSDANRHRLHKQSACAYIYQRCMCVKGSIGVLCVVRKCSVLCASCVCAMCGAALVYLDEHVALRPPRQTTAEEEAVQSRRRTRKQSVLNKIKIDPKPADMETECCNGAHHVCAPLPSKQSKAPNTIA